MQHLLQDIVVANLFAFLLIFMRLGTALMVMPGIGDSFVTMQTRLLFALSFSFVLTPFLAPGLPSIPPDAIPLALLLLSEAIIGLFIGTVMRIMVTALDTAGAVVSIQAGFSNASLFNPATATTGTVTGTLLSSLGVALLLMTDMHHMMLAAIVESYRAFPASGGVPDSFSLALVTAKTVSLAFQTGVQLTMPFIAVGIIVQMGFGILNRLMPQVQIFFLAMPVQIFLGLVILATTLSFAMTVWLNGFEAVVAQTVSP